MKIVRIITRLNIGGPARNAVLLTKGFSSPSDFIIGARLDNNSWETVLVCGEVGDDEGDMGYFARERGIEPVVVRELGRELSFWNDWMGFWKIYRIIRREKPDIIHTHTAKAGALGRLAGVVYNLGHFKSHRAILVHTFHGHVLVGYFGRLKSWIFLVIERIFALFTDRIITLSEALKKEIVEKYRITSLCKVRVVELGFELGELLNLPLKGCNDVLNIGIVGRLVAIKNHRMLFRVAKLIANHKLRTMVKFIVIGNGELKKELIDYTTKLGIEDIVEFRGWVKDAREIYRDLDIVVLTSQNEGTPVSIIEAMACGRPVVATNVGGVADIVDDGKNGYLTRSGDEEKFSERLMDLIKDSGKRKRFGEYGVQSVRERFSKDRLINDTEKMYNTLLNERRR